MWLAWVDTFAGWAPRPARMSTKVGVDAGQDEYKAKLGAARVAVVASLQSGRGAWWRAAPSTLLHSMEGWHGGGMEPRGLPRGGASRERLTFYVGRRIASRDRRELGPPGCRHYAFVGVWSRGCAGRSREDHMVGGAVLPRSPPRVLRPAKCEAWWGLRWHWARQGEHAKHGVATVR